jgi:hypothetical protein
VRRRGGITVVHAIAFVCAVVVVLAALTVVRSSGAIFNARTTSKVAATTDKIQSWVHLYSQSTDPDGQTGYFSRRGSSPAVPAATGMDDTIAVYLGGFTGTTTCNRVISLKTLATFPDTSITQVTLAASTVADTATGKQPINSIGFSAWGGTSRTTPVTIGKSVQDQLTLQISVSGLTSGTLYTPHVRITMTFTGFTTTYYQYDFPVKVYYGTGPGPG